jgi:hypothetical protein
MLKKIFVALLLLLVVIQFVRPTKNLSPGPHLQDLTVIHPTPAPVKELLRVACYDCHSNNTRYPWYAEVQPLGWWLKNHVEHGQNELNFSVFGRYTTKQAARKLDACIDEIADRNMPLPSYRLTHRDARLSDAQIQLLSDWFEETRERILEGDPATPTASASRP